MFLGDLKNKNKGTVLLPRRGRLLSRFGMSLALFFACFLFVFFLSMYYIFERTRSYVEQRPQFQSQSVAIQVGQIMRSMKEDGMRIAHFSTSTLSLDTTRIIRDQLDASPMFAVIYFVDTNGNILWSMHQRDSTSSPPVFLPDSSPLIKLDTPWKDEKGVAYMYAHYPILAQDGPVAGHLVIQFDLRALWGALVSRPEIGVWIVDNQGDSFLSSNTDVQLKDKSVGAVARYLSGNQEIAIQAHENGRDYIEAWSPVSDIPWAVIAFEPYARVYDMMQGVVYVGIGLFLLMIVLAIYQQYIFRKHLFLPLLAISQDAEKVAHGDLTVWISPEVDNELGVLASALNLLVFKLRWLNQGQEERIKRALTQSKRDEEEAEKLNAFMVHRELRMAELKEELRKCRAGDIGQSAEVET